jgi:imidazolonepropionase-like amidohydrolase
VVLLHGQGKEHRTLVRERAVAFYSFRKGSSTQDYPGSLMGAIALLRQTYLDGQWYARQPQPRKEVNLSLEAWNNTQSLPAFFEAGDHYSALRAARIGKEFGVRYTFLGDGTEYRSLEELKALGSAFVLPLNFPAPYNVRDPLDANMVSYPELLHWEWAPANAAALSQAGIPIALTTQGLESPGQFREALQKAMKHGLTEKAALAALTTEPARLAGVSAELGTLEVGKRANFLRCSGPLWENDTKLLENWVGGERYGLDWAVASDYRGSYALEIAGRRYSLDIGGAQVRSPEFSVKRDSSVLTSEASQDRNRLTLSFQDGDAHYRLSGWWMDGQLSGLGQDQNGAWANWTATRTAPFQPQPDTASKEDERRLLDPATLPRPFQAFGRTGAPEQETVLFRNATVWTNGKDGVLEGADVLVKNGKIAKVGRNLSAGDARVVDASGKHLTAGIIDEHSHIAISRGVNEGTQASTAEVRIGDVVDPSDIDIYRQLSGGVVAAQLLHGSANPIGGQSALIKLRWGASAEQMKIENADGFIKFALGENVKQSNWGDRNTIRFPQSRMGVEQVFVDHFTRAQEYGRRKAAGDAALRPDLDLEALLEILEKKRFITCHSYVQSEINMLMKVAEQFGFRINTFTHILEGYKVADKMKAHGVGASTFSDWWAYKYEVIDAIPHNAALLHKMGVVTAINSDDAEMGRRLNQEAAKAVKYGGVSEEEALKMVTLNPAILLHLDDRMGSIETGKEASIVLWSDHPLSVYTRTEQTWIDGRCYFSLEEDAAARKTLAAERNRLVLRMMDKAAEGGPTRESQPEHEHNYHCDDLEDEGNGAAH